MENSEDPDKITSSEAIWSGSTLLSKEDISAGQGLRNCIILIFTVGYKSFLHNLKL